ncbi:hypothetical protein Tco_0499244 [Tanacetum coccineum]
MAIAESFLDDHFVNFEVPDKLSRIEDSTVTYTEVSSLFEDLSNIGSPGVDGLPMMLEDPYVEAALQALPSPDYVPCPEHPPSPDFVPEPEDLEEDDEDPKEDPVDYPEDKDDDKEEEEESSGDDADDEEEDKDEDEEEEHPAPADSVPPHVHLSSPVPVSPPPLPASPTYPLGYRATMIRLRTESPSASHPLLLPSPIAPPSGTPPLLPIPLPTPSPPLLLPSTNCRAGVSEVTLPPQKRLCIALDTWDEMLVGMPGAPATDDTELGRRMTEFATMRDKRSHAYTALLMGREARLSCESWGQSMAASDAARSEVMALRTKVLDTGDSTAGSAGTRWRPAQPKIPEEAGSSS